MLIGCVYTLADQLFLESIIIIGRAPMDANVSTGALRRSGRSRPDRTDERADVTVSVRLLLSDSRSLNFLSLAAAAGADDEVRDRMNYRTKNQHLNLPHSLVPLRTLACVVFRFSVSVPRAPRHSSLQPYSRSQNASAGAARSIHCVPRHKSCLPFPPRRITS